MWLCVPSSHVSALHSTCHIRKNVFLLFLYKIRILYTLQRIHNCKSVRIYIQQREGHCSRVESSEILKRYAISLRRIYYCESLHAEKKRGFEIFASVFAFSRVWRGIPFIIHMTSRARIAIV